MSGDSKALLERAVAAASVTRTVEVARGALDAVPAVFGRHFAGRRCTVVADRNTLAAAGDRVIARLGAAGVDLAPPVVLDESPRVKPRVETSRSLAARLREAGTVPLAVGSGVINDVVKLAAELAGTPYLCVPTAASMDGYAASGASMLEDGFKHTLRCAPPVAVVADLDVVAGAPSAMAGWGYGDLSGKLVAGADWVLADALGVDPIAPGPFALVQENIRGWLANPAAVAARDARALGGLMDGLLVAGFAMQAHGNSRPASGSDHQLAHVWEMENLAIDGIPVAHGACVGVASVAMLALYEWLLARDVPARCAAVDARPPRDPAEVEAALGAAFLPSQVASARAEMAAKSVDLVQLGARRRVLAAAWPALEGRIRARLVPAATLAGWLDACGAPSRPEQIGIPVDKLTRDCGLARLIRRRYTLLDCLEDLGWLEDALAALPRAYRAIAAPAPAARATPSAVLRG